MTELPLAYAFLAGLLAAVNPCGFAMLSAYLSYHLAEQKTDAPTAPLPWRALRALALGGAATLGFLVLFSVIGLVLSLGGRAIVQLVPVAALAVGIVLVVLALNLLTGRSLHLPIPAWSAPSAASSWRGMFFYGLAYGIASLSCTLPVFLVVVGSALAASGLASAFLLFLLYASGMGAVLVAVALGAALLKGAVARWVRPLLPVVERLSALLLLAAGVYLTASWLRALGWLPLA
ncbi:MAG: cytochrome c biogenesis protein CcdA [Chloroflexi bacterium]|nr:cytochrome c biogenesis protein CcdA [Chloroflexota bacterium]